LGTEWRHEERGKAERCARVRVRSYDDDDTTLIFMLINYSTPAITTTDNEEEEEGSHPAAATPDSELPAASYSSALAPDRTSLPARLPACFLLLFLFLFPGPACRL
jgi:hypothetical protein